MYTWTATKSAKSQLCASLTVSITEYQLTTCFFLSWQGYAAALQLSWPVAVPAVCRCPAVILTSGRGMQVPCSYLDQWQCQRYAGTLQLSWSVSRVCGWSAGILVSVRGMWGPCRYPGQCEGYVGALQVSWSVPGAWCSWLAVHRLFLSLHCIWAWQSNVYFSNTRF